MKIVSYQNDPESAVKVAASTIGNGGVIVYPTDTVYGLGADATNQQAVDRLLQFKGNRNNKALSISVRDKKMASSYADVLADTKMVFEKLLPGPVTLVLPHQGKKLASGVASQEGTVGIRIIPHPFVSALASAIQIPLTATSANISGASNTRSLDDFLKSTPIKKLELIDVFIDFGPLPHRQPSTVIDLSKENTPILRQGDISLRGNTFSRSYISNSEKETQQIAQDLIQQVQTSGDHRPVVILLQGQLGAGKTVFTGGIAQSLAISKPLRSPTYTLVKEYKLAATNQELTTLYHIDAWRLSDQAEFSDLDIEGMLQPGNLIVVEWPQRVASLMADYEQSAYQIVVSIEVIDENTRKITILSN